MLRRLVLLVLALAATPSLAADGTGRAPLLPDASEFPWSAIGRINTGGRGFCSGFLVGEAVALTAAHCLYDFRNARWWHPQDVHFVAGYQRDTYVAHSVAASYRVSKSVVPRRDPKLKHVVHDWAVVQLAKPLGRQTGWLGLQRLDGQSIDLLRKGRARVVQAGYRRDRPHALTLATQCREPKTFAQGHGLLHTCDVVEGGSGSPLLLVTEHTVRALGLHSVRVKPKQGQERPGVLSVSVFHPDVGLPQAIDAGRRIGLAWGRGRLPAPDGGAARVPAHSVDALLRRLGYLESTARVPAPAGQRSDAIRRFEDQVGLAVTGESSLRLLAQLILATR